MAKSSMQDVATAIRVVSALDRKGRLVILRDLQAQGLEDVKERRVKGTVAEKALVELLEAAGGKVVDVSCEEGKE